MNAVYEYRRHILVVVVVVVVVDTAPGHREGGRTCSKAASLTAISGQALRLEITLSAPPPAQRGQEKGVGTRQHPNPRRKRRAISSPRPGTSPKNGEEGRMGVLHTEHIFVFLSTPAAKKIPSVVCQGCCPTSYLS